MFRFSFFFTLIIVLSSFNSCSNNQPKAPEPKIAELTIEGMVCEHGCKGVIEKEMKQTKGITTFDIDFEHATAEVYFDNSIITAKKIISQIETINDGSYKVKLTSERAQVNAKEQLPVQENAPVSV